METYIVLFQDGSTMFFVNRPKKSDYGQGAKLYMVSEDTAIYELPEWAARRFDYPRVFVPAKWSDE